MAPDLDGDLGVDVLIIGGGIQGLYIAREVAKTYSVCVVADPTVAAATLESSGYLSAGYDGNDANRIQPARRAAGWWRLWAESNRVPFAEEPPYYAVAPAEVSARTRLWTDAMLSTSAVDELPDIFLDGNLEGDAVFRADTDVVINPATILSHLREGLESRCIDGEIVRFGLVSDDAIDHVQVQVADQAVPIVPRFVVLAAGVGNASLLSKLGSRFSDQARRKSSKELVEGSQAVQSQYMLCVRGRDLPEVSGRFGELTIASHTLTDSGDRVWLVAPPVDDALTTLGPDNLRFERPVDSTIVSRTIDQLFAASPALAKQAADLEFSVYVARRTQHPMVAVADASIVAQPAPAKLEKFGLESFLAVWPSHLAYAQFVGDSVAERIAEALGAPQDFSDGPQPSDLGVTAPPLRARWDRTDFPWQSWSAFAAAHSLPDA